MDSLTRDDIDRRWWKESVVYQIYPRSFNDTDGDGVGDIPGIVEKLDYLDALGIDVVWLNPVYESPNADNGYDIADYRAIMDEFGTMADWETLLDGLHERDIRLVMDLVVNHTSDEHEWFVKSRESPDSDYRDYYIWRHGRTDIDGWSGHLGPEGEAPPNEWESLFGGPAWEYDEDSGEWYMHLFDVKQPDLNWENPEVRDEIFEMMEWWLEKGIDGFRMDVINLISKPDSVTQHDPPRNDTDLGATINGPKVHEYMQEMNERVLDPDLLTIGEMLGHEMPMEHAKQYVDEDGGGLSMLFHFEHMLLDRPGNIWEYERYHLPDLKGIFDRWQYGFADEGWNALYLNNHDQPRMVSRFGDDGEYRRESAKLLGTLLHTLRGTPYVYQGEELGMTNYPFENLDDYRDVETLNAVRNALGNGDIEAFDHVKDAVGSNSRDNARTPMQWTASEDFAGFSESEPWIGVNPNHSEINAETEREDPDSVWNYYRRLIELRSEYDVVAYGDYEQLTPDDETLWAYTRTLGPDRLFVVLNFSDEERQYEVPTESVVADAEEADAVTVDVLLGNYGQREESASPADLDAVDLRPWEARVYYLR